MKLEIHLLPRVRHSQRLPERHHTLIRWFALKMIYFLLIFRDTVSSPLNKKKLKAYAEDMAKKAVF